MLLDNQLSKHQMGALDAAWALMVPLTAANAFIFLLGPALAGPSFWDET